MAGAAKRSRLSELHRMLTEALIEEVRQSKEDGVPLPAADKSVIAKFLKDNDITADADSEEMQDLRDEFDDELSARREARKKEILNKISGSDSEDLLEGIV
uniref:Terminase small subunit n=1 Tax=Klebsiella phage P252 TaxID=3229729 RepID=A0AB39C5P1_9CAUD